MKKAFLLTIIILLSIPLLAQKEEEHVVRRGHYSTPTQVDTIKKPKNHSSWYNVISVRYFNGINFVNSINTYTTTVSNVSTENWMHGDENLTLESSYFSISYERLKNYKIFYYGPGIAVNYNSIWHRISSDAYIRGQLELKTENTNPGFFFSKVHPYINAAVGLTYFWGDRTKLPTTECQLHYESLFNNLIYWINGNGYDFTSGIKFYGDLGAGFTIDCGKHSAIVIGYRAHLFPCISNKLDLAEHANEIDSFVRQHYINHTDGNLYIQADTEESLKLYHGVEISFRF